MSWAPEANIVSFFKFSKPATAGLEAGAAIYPMKSQAFILQGLSCHSNISAPSFTEPLNQSVFNFLVLHLPPATPASLWCLWHFTEFLFLFNPLLKPFSMNPIDFWQGLLGFFSLQHQVHKFQFEWNCVRFAHFKLYRVTHTETVTYNSINTIFTVNHLIIHNPLRVKGTATTCWQCHLIFKKDFNLAKSSSLRDWNSYMHGISTPKFKSLLTGTPLTKQAIAPPRLIK